MVNRISNILTGVVTPSHKHIQYVNTRSVGDTLLFLDPVLIEIGKTDFCKKAKIVLKDFFANFYNAYYVEKSNDAKRKVLCHANEVNDTHLGYAKKYGHGNTFSGLLQTFRVIENYVDKLNINNMFELALYVPDFAEDGMSDLITNVLYKELSEFTLSICSKNKIECKTIPDIRYYWDVSEHCWKQYVGKSFVVNGKSFLLVPKEIVQTHYRFTVDNFLRSVIVENICEERAVYNPNTKKMDRPNKDPIREQLIKENGSPLKAITKYAEENCEFLVKYQNIVHQKYQTMILSDDELDHKVYGKAEIKEA